MEVPRQGLTAQQDFSHVSWARPHCLTYDGPCMILARSSACACQSDETRSLLSAWRRSPRSRQRAVEYQWAGEPRE